MKTNGYRTGRDERRDHYAEVTNRVIAALEAGTPPWRKPWDVNKAGGPSMPCNAATHARYRGINVITLAMSAFAFSSGDPRWATYKQAASRGWQVRAGERGTTAYFFKRLEVRDTQFDSDDESTTKRIPLLRAFTLFHASQIDGVPEFVVPTLEEAPWRAPDAVETIVANSGAVVRIGGDKAFYSPGTDHIQTPPRHAFESASAWSDTIIHEAGHWTGAKHRLNRDLRNAFGSQDYSREELRVEIAMCMVCSELGLTCDFSNNAAYIASWLERLKSDRKEIFRAAADAQKIADYLLAFHPDYRASSEQTSGTTGDDQSTRAEAFQEAA